MGEGICPYIVKKEKVDRLLMYNCEFLRVVTETRCILYKMYKRYQTNVYIDDIDDDKYVIVF